MELSIIKGQVRWTDGREETMRPMRLLWRS